jgi:hypothetical protein
MRRWGLAAIVLGAALLTITPWVVRNSLTTDRLTLISTEEGAVIAGANCDLTYRGRDLGYWHSACVGLRGDGNSARRAQRLRRQGLDYARDHAGRLPAVEGARLLRTFGLWQPERHVFFAEGRKLPGRLLAVLAVWIVLALGAAGAWALRRRPGTLAILLAPVVLALGTTLIAFGYPRFRYAADVVLIVLAATLLDRLAAQAALRRRGARESRV